MTSFGEYSQNMPSSTHGADYQLYEYSAPSSAYSAVYPSHPQSANPAFGTYSIHHAYGQNTHQDFVLDTDNAPERTILKSSYVPQSPAHSPTYSAATSFDLQPPVLSSTSDSGASVQSNLSSAIGSPSTSILQSREWNQFAGTVPSIVHQDNFHPDTFAHLEYEPLVVSKHHSCVDPALIQPNSPSAYSSAHFPDFHSMHHQQNFVFAQEPPSPAPSARSIPSSSRLSGGPIRSIRATSPYQFNPYSVQAPARRPSVSSTQSYHSLQSRNSHSSQDSSEEGKGICPIASCGRHIKDLKAHLLTHKNERPEKCPIVSCEYHVKGFARKYDKNRHTLTHYKGTMVCGFCPGSGSPSEKSFNRADVFKRHLTSVHGVEQTAPNSRRKSPGNSDSRGGFGVRETSGTCSTCGVVFPNAQDFYEHLDDCVLRVVQQGDPGEAINERLLTSIAQDKAVQQTMERHMLSTTLDFAAPTSFDQDEEEEEDDDKGDVKDGSRRQQHSTGQNEKSHPSTFDSRVNHQGMTHSNGGVPLNTTGKGNKRRKNYPLSWGAAPEKMRMKKRVMCVFDGPRRLWKDDMMLDSNNEVRVTLPGGDGRRWVTDLDIQTLRRAEGLHGATEEEKGPWLDEAGLPIAFHV